MAKVILRGATSVLLVAVAAAGGWWFLARDTAQLATSPPEIPAVLLNATATPTAEATEASTGSILTFEVNSELSEAAYFVDEELASLGVPSTAKGTTKQVNGTLYVTSDGSLAADAPSQFVVDL